MGASGYGGKGLSIVILTRGSGLGALILSSALSAAAACPPAGLDKAGLAAMKESGWSATDDARRQVLALELLDCLASPDPQLRDELAFDALSRWLRAKLIAPATLQTMRTTLMSQLRPAGADAAGFRQPFAALALAEVARVDRLQPFLSPGRAGRARRRRRRLPERGARLSRLRCQGRLAHGVAHGADLLLQLGLNPALDAGQLKAILAAIAPQVAPPGEHFYVYGEGERADGAGVLHRPAQRLFRRRMEHLAGRPRRVATEGRARDRGLARRPAQPVAVPALALRLRSGKAARPRCRPACCRA
jgi:hypothetical protein